MFLIEYFYFYRNKHESVPHTTLLVGHTNLQKQSSN